jgi:hypothetical protein
MLNPKDKDRLSGLLVMESMTVLYLEVITLEISLLLYVLFFPSFSRSPSGVMIYADSCNGPELIYRDNPL